MNNEWPLTKFIRRHLGCIAIITAAMMVCWLFSGCVTASMTCPDGKSTVSYKGIALTGNTAISCVGSVLGGDTIQVSGLDIAALAMAVAPLVAGPAPAPIPKSHEQAPSAQDDSTIINPGSNL